MKWYHKVSPRILLGVGVWIMAIGGAEWVAGEIAKAIVMLVVGTALLHWYQELEEKR